MNKQDILIFYKYNHWAKAKIMNSLSQMTEAQYLAPAAFPHGGLRGTLVHAMFAEWLWRNRWEGNSPTDRWKPEEFPTFESLRSRWLEEEERLTAFMDQVTDEKLNQTFHYKNMSGKSLTQVLWHAMVHVMNHGTQHRTEAAAMLTNFGCSPGDIDFIYFLDEL